MTQLPLVKMPDSDKWTGEKNVSVYENNGHCTIYINNYIWYEYETDNYFEERFAIVSLAKNTECSQRGLARMFGYHRNTVNGWVNDYEEYGLMGLIKLKTTPKSTRKITLEIRDYILSFDYDDPDITYNYVVDKIKEKYDVDLHYTAVNKVVLGQTHTQDEVLKFSLWDDIDPEQKIDAKEQPEKSSTQPSLPENSEKEDDIADNNERKTSLVELKNTLKNGLISCYGAGFIMFYFLKQLNLIDVFKEVLDVEYIEDYSYDLKKIIKTLVFMIIFEFSSFEQFKTVSHKEFGPLIGYHRAPSVKLIRNRLDEIAKPGCCDKLMDNLARQYLKNDLVNLGVLYLDGHPVPYYGCEKTPKKFFSTRNLALKAEQHIYVNGKEGRPFFFKFSDASRNFMDLIPEIADHAQKLISEVTDRDAPLIFVFDREPYSSELFKRLTEKGHIFICWRKYDKKASLTNFDKTLTWKVDEKTTLHYPVYRRQIKVGKQKYPIEALSFYCKEDDNFDPASDKPATLVTNVNKFNPEDYNDFEGLSSLELIIFMCGRWQQENFFKIMKNQYSIDHHPDYEFEELIPQPEVKNPAIKEAKKEIKKLKRKLNKIKNKLGEKFSDARYNDKSLEHYQNLKTSSKLLQRKEELETKIEKLKDKIKQLPEKVPFDKVTDAKMKIREIRRKLFMDILKTAVYNAKEMALTTFAKYYDRPKDIRVIFEMLIKSNTYLKLENNILKVLIQKPQRPKYQKAFTGFLKELNNLDVKDANGLADKIEFKLADLSTK